MHPVILRELADEVAKPLSIVFESSWQSSEVPSGKKKRKITPIFKTGKKKTQGIAVVLTSISVKIMEQEILL